MKRLLAMVLALIMVFSMVGCTSDTTTDDANSENNNSATTPNTNDANTTNEDANKDDATEDADKEASTTTGPLKIGVSTNALANAHNRHMFEGVIAIAKERGHEVVEANANGDAAQQANDVENLVQAGCDVIIIQNGDNFSLKNAVTEALESGVHIISHDTGWIDGIDCMFQLNSIKVQADICMLLAAEVGFSGKIITTGHQDVFALRAGGYMHDAFLQEYDFEEVAHVQTTFPGTTEVTYNGLDSALTAHPDVVAIFTSQDLEAMGAVQALKEHGLDDKVKCIGVDGEIDTLNDIKAGGPTLCTAIADLDGANQEVVETAEKICAGETVAKYHEVPYDIVTAENVDEFLAKAEEDAKKYAE